MHQRSHRKFHCILSERGNPTTVISSVSLSRTSIHPGEVVSGYLYTTDRKAADLFVKVKSKGIDYVFEWKTGKKK